MLDSAFSIFSCRYVLVLQLASLLCGCINEPSQLDMLVNLPVADGAIDVDRRFLGSEANQQIFYRVRKPYRSKELLHIYRDYFTRRNWHQCEGEMEEWSSYIDKSKDADKQIHQIASYWIDSSETMLATVVLRYELDFGSLADDPNRAIQDVIVLVTRNLEKIQAEFTERNRTCNR